MKNNFFTGIKNAFLNIGFALKIKIRELFIFGKNKWWWKLFLPSFFIYSVSSPYRIAKKEAENYPEYKFDNFSYGDTPPLAISKILQNIDYKNYSQIFDLGSGKGTAAISFYFLSKLPVTGIELLPGYIIQSNRLKEITGATEVNFINKDLKNMDFSRKAIYYCASTAFEDGLMHDLTENLKQLPGDSIITIVHNPLPEDWFELFHKERMQFTWGYDTVFFYRRTFPDE
ncbi:MAG: hypothetical protein ACLFQV_00030 [Vulcanimicrobiota bacterium]